VRDGLHSLIIVIVIVAGKIPFSAMIVCICYPEVGLLNKNSEETLQNQYNKMAF